MILARGPLNQHVLGLAKALYTRGFDVEGPVAEFDDSGHIAFSIAAIAPGGIGGEDNGVRISLDEEVLGQPARRHYVGREIPDGYVAIEWLTAVWLEPGPLRCTDLVCLD